MPFDRVTSRQPPRRLTRADWERIGTEVCDRCEQPAVVHVWGVIDNAWICANCMAEHYPERSYGAMEATDATT